MQKKHPLRGLFMFTFVTITAVSVLPSVTIAGRGVPICNRKPSWGSHL